MPRSPESNIVSPMASSSLSYIQDSEIRFKLGVCELGCGVNKADFILTATNWMQDSSSGGPASHVACHLLFVAICQLKIIFFKEIDRQSKLNCGVAEVNPSDNV